MTNNSKKIIFTLTLLLSTSVGLQAKWYDYTPVSWLMGKSKQQLGQELLEAIRNQEYREEILELLENDPDVNVQDDRGITSLMLSVSQNDILLTQALLEKGADPNMHEMISGLNALIISTENGNIKMAELLIEYGAEIEQPMALGFTTLTYAVLQDQLKLAKFLLQQGANPNTQGWIHGLTPLMLAISKENTEMVKLLLSYNADLNIQDFSENEQTAVDYAKEKENLEIIALLTGESSCDFEDNQE